MSDGRDLFFISIRMVSFLKEPEVRFSSRFS